MSRDLLKDSNMYLVDNIDDAWEMKRWLSQRRDVLGLDTETSGLDPYAKDAKLRTIQIGDHNTGWTIPWEQWGGVALECLNAWSGPIALHNAAFDAHWLDIHANWKLPWERTHDTMIMAQINDPGKPASLKGLSTLHVDPRANNEQGLLKQAFKDNGWDWGTIPVNYDTYWVYAALDPILTSHLWSHYRTDLKYPEVYDLEMSTLRICTKMERSGMRVDPDYSRQKLDEINEFVEKSKQWAKENWGISITSTQQLAGFFQDTLKAQFEIFTAGGAPSVNKAQLEIFQASDVEMIRETANFISKVRHSVKMGSAYFENFLKMNTDGIVHPSIRTLGARTGRMSIVDPALQTIPRGDAEIRNAFIPRNENESLISCDFSQIEMRLLSHFSKDSDLQESFREADRVKGDFFVTIGQSIYNDSSFSKADHRRGLVKSTMYGAAYGSGIPKMAATAGVSEEQMRSVADAVFRAYPGIKRFMKEVEQEGEKNEKREGEGYVILESGRRLPADSGKMYTLTNFTLQGTAAELMKKAIVRLDAAGFGDYFQVPIHDEMIFSIPNDLIKEAMPEIEEVMSYSHGEFAVDIPAEPEFIGKRWGAKYDK